MMTLRPKSETPGSIEHPTVKKSADLYVTVILVIVFLGTAAAFKIYSSIEITSQLRQLNFQQIIAWEGITQRLEFLMGARENRVESDVLTRQLQSDLGEIIDEADERGRKIDAILHDAEKSWFPFGPDRGFLKEALALDIAPELQQRALEVRDAPMPILRTNFDYWPISTTIGIQSKRFIAPLYERETLFSEYRAKQLRNLYAQSFIVIAVVTASIVLIWLAFLRPSVRRLSEAQFEMQFVLDNAPGMICSYDAQGYFQSANSAYLELMGASSLSDVKGRHISSVVPSDIWSQIDRHVERASRGELQRFELKSEFNGSEKVLLATHLPNVGTDGHVKGIVALILDITERFRAAQALRLSEENLRITLDAIGDAVISTDNTGTVTRMNPKAVQLTGWAEADAVWHGINEVCQFLDPLTETPVSDLLRDIGQADPTTQSQFLMNSKSGAQYHVAASASPIKTSENETVGAVLVIRDITEEFRLNQQLIQDEKLKSIGQLAGGIAHDFNNILAGLQGAVDVIAETERQGEALNPDLIEQTTRLIRRGAGLTDQLTLFARVKNPNFQSINVRVLIEDSLDIVRNTSDRRITFDFIDTSHNVTIYGSESTLQTAILNMLLNAVDAITDTGHIRVSLKNKIDKDPANPDAEKTWLRLEISDDGEGIDEANLSRIFDPFFTTKEVGSGTGLGLAVAYGTIEALGGEIRVASQPGKGTTFMILVPCEDDGEPAPAGRPKSSAAYQSLEQSKTVLFADDEDLFRETTRMSLERLNYRVIAAENGSEALSLFWKHKDEIDIILLDMNMPKKNGFEVLEAIGDLAANYRVFISTGYSGGDQGLGRDLKLHYEILEKPYEIGRLANALQGNDPPS